ncbi:MAG: NAD(P)-dependent oxidoreductase [Planctomycetota bacterium]|nr:NAD(P)-dependent oxidoreductase [Planctomycetota bacterium]
MRVLITGGYGCIGSWIVKQLLEQDAEIWIYDLREDLQRMQLVMESGEIEKVRYIQGDVQDVQPLRAAMEQNRIDHVLHLAALQVPACRENPVLGAQVNVVGTLAVFEAVRQLQNQIHRVVYASSAAAHSPPGQDDSGMIGDDARMTPVTHYGAFKVANENNAQIYWLDHNIVSIGLRPWTVYGVGRDQGLTSQPTKAMKAVAVGRPYHIAYAGRQDMQYVADVAGTFSRCLVAPYSGAAVYNLRGAVVDMSEFYETLCRVAPQAKDLITYGGDQIPISFDLDDSKLTSEIGDIPKTSLTDGIEQTIDHFKKLDLEKRLDTSDLDT